MPPTLYYRPSFKRCLKKLDPTQARIIGLVLEALTVYYAANNDLVRARKIAPRFFYKQLRRPYYEAGVESNLRVIVRREDDKCIAMLCGNHDDIRRFLADA